MVTEKPKRSWKSRKIDPEIRKRWRANTAERLKQKMREDPDFAATIHEKRRLESSKYRQKNPGKYQLRSLQADRHKRQQLSQSYIKKIAKQRGVPNPTNELIEVMKSLISLKRLVYKKQLKS